MTHEMSQSPLPAFRPTSRQGWFVLGGIVAAVALAVGVHWRFSVWTPGERFEGPLPPATPSQRELARDLERDVRHLALEIGERNLTHPEALERAAAFIEVELRQLGPRRQTFEVNGIACHNIEVERHGVVRPGEIVIVGAHYDSAYETPGANDNGSGVAALLALGRKLSEVELERTVRLVFFTNEEPPHFKGPDMGSVRYASRSAQRGEDIVAMLSLETMGYFTNAPDTQNYPPPLALAYPKIGNFIAFVGDSASRALVHEAIDAFREHTAFPSEGAALSGALTGVGWSDHWAFWQHRIPAIMITDTAPFRYPYYHHEDDTPERLDYDALSRVTEGVLRVIERIARARDD